MSKTKVLQFSIGNVRGGVTQYALNNWKFIDKSKFQFDFVTFGGKLDFEEELTKQGCKVHYVSCYAEDGKEKFAAEINRILEHNYDALHLHTEYWRGFRVEELAIKYGVPKIIVHSHNGGVGEDRSILEEDAVKQMRETHRRLRDEISPKLATDFWACSKLAAEWLYGAKVPRDQIKIMNNAIDIGAFSYCEETRKACRKELGLEDCFVIGHIGRFAHQKNHEMLIDIFRAACRKIANAKLVLIGVGWLEEKIRAQVESYRLTDKVIFLSKRDDVNRLMQAMDIFALPSLFEGLPIVLVEAQAAGLKCLASTLVTDEVGITENMEFLPLNVEHWSERIVDLSKGYRRGNMDEAITAAGYNIRKQIKVLEQLYAAP